MSQQKPAESAKHQNPPAQSQSKQPGEESKMDPPPIYVRPDYQGSNKLKGKVALITGGDSGIGRAVAVAFAIEGADLAIVYKEESRDAEHTRREIEKAGRRCLLLAGDVGDESFCRQTVDKTLAEFGRSSIINTTSVTAYRGSPKLLDYSSTKGAIVAFTRSLSGSLAKKGIRVNGVAPGPIWTPLIPATFDPEKVAKFGQDVPLGRPGQPCEVSGAYVFLASDDATYITGQVIHPNGGEIVNA